jgi:hypothetical protein
VVIKSHGLGSRPWPHMHDLLVNMPQLGLAWREHGFLLLAWRMVVCEVPQLLCLLGMQQSMEAQNSRVLAHPRSLQSLMCNMLQFGPCCITTSILMCLAWLCVDRCGTLPSTTGTPSSCWPRSAVCTCTCTTQTGRACLQQPLQQTHAATGRRCLLRQPMCSGSSSCCQRLR